MNKSELVRAIAADADVSLKAAEAMVNSFTTNVTKSVSKGKKVSLVGFGTFSVVKRKARTGRNPATGKEIKIPAKKVPKFAPGKKFRDSV
ncbi:HU family DNA-binding protein [Calditrichota bacterium]